MTIEERKERIEHIKEILWCLSSITQHVEKLGISNFTEAINEYVSSDLGCYSSAYSAGKTIYDTAIKFLTPSSDVKDDEQQLLQQILNKVDNTLTSTQYLPGSRVLNLEDLNAFLEYVIPIWLSLEQAKRNVQFWQNNGNQTD